MVEPLTPETTWLAEALIDATEDPNTFEPTEHPDYWRWVAETITSRHDWPGLALATEPSGERDGLVEDGRKWREAEAEGHVVTFTETGYGLMHPPSCRPDLIGCWFNTYLADRGYPEEEPGRYRMTRHKGHAEYSALDTGEPARPIADHAYDEECDGCRHQHHVQPEWVGEPARRAEP